MKKWNRRIFSFLLALLMCLSIMNIISPVTEVYAAETIINSGTTRGGCPWRINSKRELVFGTDGMTYSMGSYPKYTDSTSFSYTWPWYKDILTGNVRTVRFEGTVKITGPMGNWLYKHDGSQDFEQITSIDCKNADFSGLTSASGLFANAGKVYNFDSSTVNWSNVTDFDYAFIEPCISYRGVSLCYCVERKRTRDNLDLKL